MHTVKMERAVEFKKRDPARQIVFGEVYVPGRPDTDGNWMTAETVEDMAHAFMLGLKARQISREHAGAKDKGAVVESFIAREGDPIFIPGAWVVGVKVFDATLWDQIMGGELTGFSIEGTAQLIEEG